MDYRMFNNFDIQKKRIVQKIYDRNKLTAYKRIKQQNQTKRDIRNKK